MHYRDRLREWISDHDLKQKKLAGELDITESVISNYMTGRSQMPIEMLVKMADHFGVSVDYLAGVSDNPEPPVRLSTTEQQLVQAFRTLTPLQKELILQNVQFMQEQNRRE
ncbi:MAG: helix-turn-helix transcriptional regulator [Lawsonibacter sp.]|nr:helix-turn-helix transcriptional regulator [Lawsonibacter sp.]